MTQALPQFVRFALHSGEKFDLDSRSIDDILTGLQSGEGHVVYGTTPEGARVAFPWSNVKYMTDAGVNGISSGFLHNLNTIGASQ